MARECDDAAREVDRAKRYLRWCIESGTSESGLDVARDSLTLADEEFDQAIREASIGQREAFIIASQIDPASQRLKTAIKH